MYDIKKCEKIETESGAIYIGESTAEKSVGYLELKPHSSLPFHKREGAIENLTQIKGDCVMIVFDTPTGTKHKLNEGDKLQIKKGVEHIHNNPFDITSLTYWHFEGDIRRVIEEIRNK